MIVYHFFWDLGYFGLIDLGLITQGLGLLIAQIIGLSFITIAGVSSRLLSLSNNFRPKFVKRFLILVLISSLISAATFLLDRDSFIFFWHFTFSISMCIDQLISNQDKKQVSIIANLFWCRFS